jgi:glycosyltransferase involved in cell wall biosynthesis
VKVFYDARHSTLPGIGRFAIDLWSAMRELEPNAIAIIQGRHQAGWLGPQEEIVPPPTVSVRSGPFSPSDAVTLPRLLQRGRAEIFHSPHFNIPLVRRIPTVITVHDLFPLKHRKQARSALASAYYRTVMPRAIQRADRVVAVSRFAFDDIALSFPMVRPRLRMVPHGIDHDRWRPQPPEVVEHVREKLRLPETYFLYVGTAKWHKNLGTLLAALRPDLPPLVLAGPTGAELAAAADVPSCRGTVIPLGRVTDELPALYAGALAVVLPSLYESVGFTALEAMAVGIPLVSSEGAALPDTVGDAGLLVEPLDTKGWTVALERICGDAGLRRELVEAGFARVARRSWKAAAESYHEVYDELV